MTDIVVRTSPAPNVDGQSALTAERLAPYQAGVSLAKGDAVYIDSNSRLQKAVSTVIGITGSHQAWAKFDGIVVETYISGSKGCAIYGAGTRVGYASGMTVGNFLWVSNSAGKLNDAMQSAVDMPVAKIVSATDIFILR